MTDLPLAGKVALVTGAGRGIGQVIAIGYAKAGAAVCCAARSQAQIDEAAALISQSGGRSTCICVNGLIPGPVLTAFIAGREETLRAGAAGGEWMNQPEDVVPMALFLALQPFNGPTGQSFSLARREL